MTAIYVPSAQSVHVGVENPVPVMYVPAAQAEHTEAPVPVLYFPVGHSKHA